jgi:hypothetical protein
MTLAGRQGFSAPFSDGVGSTATFCYPSGVALDGNGTYTLVVRKAGTAVQKSVLKDRTTCGQCVLYYPACVFQFAGGPRESHMIRLVIVSSGKVTTLAGLVGVSSPLSDGVGIAATFYSPSGVALASDGKVALVVRVVGKCLA